MTRLILIRHAKSAWDDPMADDHARILNARGRRSAALIGDWLHMNGYRPTHILCSDAARTAETARRLLPSFETPPEISYHRSLYHAAPGAILDLITATKADPIAVIGHNPGIGSLAQALVATPPDHPRFRDYPTCATTVIDFDGPIAPGRGTCVDFVVPRNLSD